MQEPLRRPQVKKKCRHLESIICKSNTSRQEVEEKITEVFGDHFGLVPNFVEPRFKLNGTECKIKWDTWGLNFNVCYYRRPVTESDSKKVIHLDSIYKRVALANFIFKECNPIGLDLLEKSVFMVI